MLGNLGDKLGIKDVPTVITVVKMRLGSSVDSVKLHTYRLTDWPLTRKRQNRVSFKTDDTETELIRGENTFSPLFLCCKISINIIMLIHLFIRVNLEVLRNCNERLI